MRKLLCKELPGHSVEEVLGEFNERAAEFGITSETDIVSVSAMPATAPPAKLGGYTAAVPAKVVVVIVYWSNE